MVPARVNAVQHDTNTMRGSKGKKISIPLPNTGFLLRRKRRLWLRGSILIGFSVVFTIFQLHVFSQMDPSSNAVNDVANDSTAAIYSMVPVFLHKYLKARTRNETIVKVLTNGTHHQSLVQPYHPPNCSEMQRAIRHYNELQMVLNEDQFGPLENDSVIIVVQVHTRITYLRHLIVSLAQARHIESTLLIFSHDYYDEDINDLVQSIDFCKVMQIFYPHSMQTHPYEFPGVDPGDCPRNIKRDQAIIRKCNNALYPDLYGHYREAKFTQTKHHWWWKANRVFDQLYFTREHYGMVLFLEEDHYVSEDFLHLLKLMEAKSHELCAKCNVLSLGTYLKTYNYYAFNNNNKPGKTHLSHSPVDADGRTKLKQNAVESWRYEILPTLYGQKQKVELTPWISSKHNMGFAFNRSTWRDIVHCTEFFCTYDDYNWDWSLQHVSQQCMRHKLHAMVVKGPRVFHIGECGVHHKKLNCESNQVISKVQQIIRSAARNGKLYPTNLAMTVASVLKKTKLRKGNGGWGDRRDYRLCVNMTQSTGVDG